MKNKMTHTSGPWSFSDATADITHKRAVVYIEGDGGRTVVAIIDPYNTDEDASNLRLITAAPDLLEVAKDAAELIERGKCHQSKWSDMVIKLRSVIARVEEKK